MKICRGRLGALVFAVLVFLLPAAPLPAQDPAPGQEGFLVVDPRLQDREVLHLNTIGTYSAGFVLQSYGYIGVLADVLSQGVYTRDMVLSMLNETITYLNNAGAQLQRYGSPEVNMAPGDLTFLNKIRGIIGDLVSEAEALSDLAGDSETDVEKREADLARFHAARNKAWSGIKTTLRVE
ncbi:MAG: hypothetical protein LBP95_05070 [Deltaproteobacteria bacterium]|jgi:hypothetical protein|nr:hypothetical protein [Deltaproteobacteria bacterium]MDR1297062.1 hypothetical protein [Deltaproteobacteria bacterium]